MTTNKFRVTVRIEGEMDIEASNAEQAENLVYGMITSHIMEAGDVVWGEHEVTHTRMLRTERKTAMISGHLSLTEEEFTEHYKQAILAAMALGHRFIIGDAPGADKMAQQFLIDMSYDFDSTFIVYCGNFAGPRNNLAHWRMTGAGMSQAGKDRYMTEHSDYDIAWVRPGREKSGTADNIKRRAKMKKE